MLTLVSFLGGLVIGSVGVVVMLKKKTDIAETLGICPKSEDEDSI